MECESNDPRIRPGRATRLRPARHRSFPMSTSPSVHLADAENRDIFDLLESCEKLLTARDVARILSISEKTVYSYVSRTLIPHYKTEHNLRFRAPPLPPPL